MTDNRTKIASLITKDIMRKITPGEKQELDKWIQSSEQNKETYMDLTGSSLKKIYTFLQSVNMKSILGNIKNKIAFEKENP